jgi:3-oxoadipate enol-lactonase
MPEMQVNGARIHYEEDGVGEPPLVFAHGLLLSGRVFDRQVDAFQQRHRCISFDFRGHGRSSAPATGYGLDSLTEDARALVESRGPSRCHFIGHSLGGLVGLRLAIRHPELLSSLTLLNVTPAQERWAQALRLRLLSCLARAIGIEWVADRVLSQLFGPVFLDDPCRHQERNAWRAKLVANDLPGILRALTGVLTREAVSDQLARITTPTLIIAGEQDRAVPVADAELLHHGIRGSRLVILPRAGHTTPVEEPRATNHAIEQFLSLLPADERGCR